MVSKSEIREIVDYLSHRLRRAREHWASLNKVQRFIRMTQVVLLISLFVALKIHYFYATGSQTWNPFPMLVYMFQTKFPLVLFVITAALLEIPVLILTLYRDQFGIPDPNRDFEVSKHGTYGTAEQLTEMQLREWGGAEILPVEDTDGPIFGMIDDNARKVVSFNLKDKAAMMNRHILVFGASMSGKTFSFVLPHLLQICRRGESVVMSDPKGELFTKTSEYFKSYGYVVRVLNFNEFQYSDGWDILSELGDPSDVAKVQERAQIFAETVIANTMSNTEDMFRSAPLSLLKAVMLRVYLDPDMEHTFESVYDIISNPGGKDFFDKLFDENVLTGDLKCCIGPYSTYRQQSANLAGNTLSGLANAIQIFQTERIRKLTSMKGIDLTLPGKRKCAYYLIFPDQHETYKFLTSLLFSFLFIDLVAYADATPEHHCKVHVNCLFEEAKSVGYIPGFATKLSNIRSRWIYITSIWQDLAQVQFLYPDEWSSILNNSSTQLCLGFNDMDTAKLFSDRSGGATIIVDTKRHGAFETELDVFHPHNVGEGTRMVFTPDELLRASKNECFIIFQRMNMMKCNKFPVTLHPDYERMEAHPVLPQDVVPSIDDDDARASYEEELIRKADEYQTWLDAGNVETHGNASTTESRKNSYDIDPENDSLFAYFAKKAMKRAIDKSAERMPTSDDLGKEGEDWDWEIDFDATMQSKEADRSVNTRGSRLLVGDVEIIPDDGSDMWPADGDSGLDDGDDGGYPGPANVGPSDVPDGLPKRDLNGPDFDFFDEADVDVTPSEPRGAPAPTAKTQPVPAGTSARRGEPNAKGKPSPTKPETTTQPVKASPPAPKQSANRTATNPPGRIEEPVESTRPDPSPESLVWAMLGGGPKSGKGSDKGKSNKATSVNKGKPGQGEKGSAKAQTSNKGASRASATKDTDGKKSASAKSGGASGARAEVGASKSGGSKSSPQKSGQTKGEKSESGKHGDGFASYISFQSDKRSPREKRKERQATTRNMTFVDDSDSGML